MTGLLRLALVGFFAAISAIGAHAETRALLIGVSDYDDASGIEDLRGPANDVRLLKDVLSARDVSDIAVLADGVMGSARPTRAAILSAFEALIDRTSEDDFVYIHLSGHGSRQADQNGDETDGLDEVFLPADVAKSEGGGATIPNAIADDDIGAVLSRLTAKGAKVWIVMDACHAGSGIRSGDPRIATRYVDPGVLGISVNANSDGGQTTFDAEGSAQDGAYLAFYAARSYDLAHEVNLAGPGEDAAWYGLFTSKLAARLQSSNPGSFRSLFQGVLSDLNDTTVPAAARVQTPSWEGTLMDARVFTGANAADIRRFAVTEDVIEAGLLHGVPAGSVVGLVADASDAPDAIIGYAQTEDTSAAQSYLRPVAPECVPVSDEPCAPTGTLSTDARFAQVIARPLDRETVFAVPKHLNGDPLADDHPARLALSEAVVMINAEGDHAVALSPGDFQVDVLWDGTALWFGQVALQGQSPVGLRWVPDTVDLDDILRRIAQAEEMVGVLTAVGQMRALLSQNPVDVAPMVKPVDLKDLAPRDNQEPIKQECTRAYRYLGNSASALEPRAQLKQCDLLEFSVKAQKPGARDVNRIYIDSQFCMSSHYQRLEGASAAAKLGPDMTLCSDCPGGPSAGSERLFVIVSDARENVEGLNLSGLVENCGPDGATRGLADNRAIDFLRNIIDDPGTRSAAGGFSTGKLWVDAFSWQILTRQEAFARSDRLNKE
ncbi:MAG: caspase family protein [Pseudomonadota bacterium]